MTAEILGYVAIVIGLIAMSQKKVTNLRIIHSISAFTYVIYGLWIEAYPITVGGLIFMIIHIWHLYKVHYSESP